MFIFIYFFFFSFTSSGSNYAPPDVGVVVKQSHEEPDSPGSPAPLAIVESPETPEHQQVIKRQRISDTDDH